MNGSRREATPCASVDVGAGTGAGMGTGGGSGGGAGVAIVVVAATPIFSRSPRSSLYSSNSVTAVLELDDEELRS